MSNQQNQPYTVDLMLRDIGSKFYREDPDFRAAVEARIASGVHHGGTAVGNSGMVDFGRDGGSAMGGVSVLVGSQHRESGGAFRASIDDTATYDGDGFKSAEDIANAIADPQYKSNPAYREAVAWGISQMQAKDGLKF